MPVDNEHIELKREIARAVGRSVPSAMWSTGDMPDRLDEAEDSEVRDQGIKEIAARITELLRLYDDGLRAGLERERRRRGPGAPDPDLLARIEAISRLAADHAGEDAEVLRFRDRHLDGGRPLDADGVEVLLDSERARGVPENPDRHGRPALLRYQNATIAHDIHVWPRSMLDDLRVLADDLARSYPWQPAQAAAFVLEGQIPLATPMLLHLPQRPAEDRPARARLILEVDLWMPADVVMRAYRRAQREVLRGHNRPTARRSIDVVNFVLKNRPGTWPALMERWNTEHPDTPFADYRAFRTIFDRNERALLSPRYRITMGPGA